MTTPSLFDTPVTSSKTGDKNLLPKEGEVYYYPNFFSKADSDRLFKSLIENILWQQDQIKFFGKTHNIPRLTAWYGDNDKSYSYSGIPMNPHPWTRDLVEIKNKIEEVAQINFSSVLLNRYRSGKDSVSWHCDDEPELGINPLIGSVSFGAARTFKFRNLADKSVEKVELTHGSYILMMGETQHRWEHQVPKTSKALTERINLTFRVIK